MLRNRIEGLIGIHSAVISMMVAALFVATMMILPWLGVVTFNGELNFGLYFFGVLAAMAWVHRNLGSESVKTRYGRLTKIETLRLTVHQMMRLMLVVFTLAVLTKDVSVSRLFVLTFLVASGLFLLAANFFLPRVLSFLFFRDTTYRTAVLATPEEAKRIANWISKYRGLGVEVVGYVSDAPSSAPTTLPWMGRPDELMEIVSRNQVDQVLLDQSAVSHAEARLITARCEQLGCRARCFVDIASIMPSSSVAIEKDERYAFASFTAEPLENPMNRASKRVLDIAVSLPVVLFVLPAVFLVTAIMQRIQSPGPLIYRQIRSGMNRRKFYIYKLRTMHVDDGRNVAKQATRGDTRVYPFGKFLRRSSIDELPQFLNVLRGEMSVSGPRPHLTQHDDAFAQVVSNYRKRHFVKPGITGLAQSKGFRGEIAEHSSLVKRVRYDTHYVAKWSLAMDIRIIFNTIRQIVAPPPSAF